MPTYQYECRECECSWDETYSIHTIDIWRPCPNCQGGDTYRCISAPAVHFKGPGWSPTGYSKSAPLEKLAKQLPVKVYGSKEDHDREMRGEAQEREKRRLKREHEIAKKAMGPDAGVWEYEAERRIKKAGDEAVGGPK